MDTVENYLEVLKNEFEAGEGSFLIQLRPHLEWDKASFSRLVAAMKTCCECQGEQQMVERWIADGFWYLSHFVEDWTTHKNFPRVHSPEYYEQAYVHLYFLACWYFQGESFCEEEAFVFEQM